jgi:hypothetical protein
LHVRVVIPCRVLPRAEVSASLHKAGLLLGVIKQRAAEIWYFTIDDGDSGLVKSLELLLGDQLRLLYFLAGFNIDE